MMLYLHALPPLPSLSHSETLVWDLICTSQTSPGRQDLTTWTFPASNPLPHVGKKKEKQQVRKHILLHDDGFPMAKHLSFRLFGPPAMLSPAHSGSLATAAMGLQRPRHQGWIVHSDRRRPTPRRMLMCWFARTEEFRVTFSTSYIYIILDIINYQNYKYIII